jgi:undecaprenyl-diphosphatase
MARWHFGATQLDRRVAKAVARHASPAVERPARLLTWAADEHLLYVVAGFRIAWRILAPSSLVEQRN